MNDCTPLPSRICGEGGTCKDSGLHAYACHCDAGYENSDPLEPTSACGECS